MKQWQKYWLVFLIIFSTLHLIRDVQQDLRIITPLSEVLVKQKLSGTPVWYWKLFNTYFFAFIEICLSAYCLKRNQFGKMGLFSIVIALAMFFAWLSYYFLF